MKYTHRSQGPRKGIGNAFVPGKIEPSRGKRRSRLSATQRRVIEELRESAERKRQEALSAKAKALLSDLIAPQFNELMGWQFTYTLTPDEFRAMFSDKE